MMMDDAEHLITAVLQIFFQRFRFKRIDAEDDVRMTVFIPIHPDMGDVAMVADKDLGDLADSAKLILHADDDAAAFLTVTQDLQKSIEHIVLCQDAADLSIMAASSMSASSWMVITLRIMIVSTVVLESK